MGTARPRILFLDAYDSFANNITALLAARLGADVHVLRIDAAPLAASPAAFCAELACYDAVVCGPGPGSPARPDDVGLMQAVWQQPWAVDSPAADRPAADRHVTPALGICLGLQSLVAAHGGRVRRLRSGGLHGMVRAVATAGGDVFAGVAAPFRATLYHSLGADLGQDAVAAADWPAARWRPLPACPDLVPLAWVEEPPAEPLDGGGQADRLLMAVRHRARPFWGLQYHPESVCTDAASHAVLDNWFRAALQWNAARGRVRAEPPPGRRLAAQQATRPSLLSRQPSVAVPPSVVVPPSVAARSRLVSRTLPLPAHMDVPGLVEALQASGGGGGVDGGADEPELIVLDSASASEAAHDDDDDVDVEATRGRYSIVALNVGAALRIEYRSGDRHATLRRPGSDTTTTTTTTTPPTETVPLQDAQSIWQLLAAFHEARRHRSPHAGPFVGGFVGYVTYEQGLGDLGIPLPPPGRAGRGHDRPDLCFAWVTQSLVVDHARGVVRVQELGGPASSSWVDATVARLQGAPPWTASAGTGTGTTAAAADVGPPPPVVRIDTPDAAAYEDQVRACQEHIAAGDAYELCLTDETRVHTGPSPSWRLYRRLRAANPAPFASYVRLGGATLVSSSPERFLCFGAASEGEGEGEGGTRCSMRPMKGTVRRSAAVATRAQAAAVLRVPKEEAENLMIVDLVRHDLHGVCGPGRVAVPRLLQVEPYGHVFQMVSVVEGWLPTAEQAPMAGETAEPVPPPTGLDVLAASLPPGSMTGAPKKRSCALLRGLERRRGERSLYAGVVGYWCASGRGDWSVTIRSLFRWDDERSPAADVWHVGAGGAVTILSTPAAERDEMQAKLAGPLRAWGL